MVWALIQSYVRLPNTIDDDVNHDECQLDKYFNQASSKADHPVPTLFLD